MLATSSSLIAGASLGATPSLGRCCSCSLRSAGACRVLALRGGGVATPLKVDEGRVSFTHEGATRVGVIESRAGRRVQVACENEDGQTVSQWVDSKQLRPALPPAETLMNPERTLFPLAFAFAVSIAVVSLSPAKALVDKVGSDMGTQILAIVAAISALFEIIVSPVLGAASDTFGRKPILLGTLASVVVVQSLTAFMPTVELIATSKFVCSLVVGLFFLTSGAILADAYRSSPGRLAAASGMLTALIFGGSSCGVFLSTRLPPGAQASYAASAVAALVSLVSAAAFLRESVPPERRLPFGVRSLSPLSGFRLLRLSRRTRRLTLLLALSLQPLFMGDVLQVAAMRDPCVPPRVAPTRPPMPGVDAAGVHDRPVEAAEVPDDASRHSAAGDHCVCACPALAQPPPPLTRLAHAISLHILVRALPQLAGMVANTASGRLISALGVRSFAALAMSSELIYWLGFSTSHQMVRREQEALVATSGMREPWACGKGPS